MSAETLEDHPAAEPVTGNKKQLALALGVHLVTLDRWLERFGDAVPCIQRGALGRAYLFDIAATTAFFAARREEELARQSARDDQLAQLALPISLPDAGDPGVLSLKDQLAALRLRTMQREEAQRLKLLVSAAEMKERLAEMFGDLGRRLHQRTREAARECGLPEEITRKLTDALANAQREAVDDIRRKAPEIT